MKNSLINIAFVSFALVLIMGVSAVSAETTNGSDDTIAPVITTPSETTNSSSLTNGDDDAVAPPAQDEQTGGNTIPSSTNGDDDAPAVQIPVPVVPPVTPPSGGSSVGGSTGSSGSVPTNLPVVSSIISSSCPLITDYLKLGGANNPSQVTKLQAFLKNVEKLDVDVNGLFDQKTENAVKAFQTKYATSILGPWSASQASGFVYITTIKTINQIACASQFSLTADEQAIIDSYKARRDQVTPEGVQIGQENSTTPTNGGTLEIGSNEQSGNENVAAVAQSSILSRFWNFIKELF